MWLGIMPIKSLYLPHWDCTINTTQVGLNELKYKICVKWVRPLWPHIRPASNTDEPGQVGLKNHGPFDQRLGYELESKPWTPCVDPPQVTGTDPTQPVISNVWRGICYYENSFHFYVRPTRMQMPEGKTPMWTLSLSFHLHLQYQWPTRIHGEILANQYRSKIHHIRTSPHWKNHTVNEYIALVHKS